MPSEFRTLVFSMPEIEAALGDYLHANPVSGNFVGCDLGTAEPHRLFVTFAAGGNQSRVEMRSEIVGAAMIGYCRSKRIPLPRQARKRLRYTDTSISLDLTYGDAGDAAMPVAAQ